MSGAFRDISTRLRAEALQARNDQLEREQHARYLEKMAALGKLSAGLSHELNNPAAAAQRASKTLMESMRNRDAACQALIDARITSDSWNQLCSLVGECIERRAVKSTLSAMESSRLEDELIDWLDSRGVSGGWNYASSFAQAGITVDRLSDLAEMLPAGMLSAAITMMGESLTAEEQVTVISRSSDRISELVGAVKSYSFRDQATEQDVDIHEGLENTLVILAHPLKSMHVERSYDHSIPLVRTYGSGLNQVWTNILDNAVDATGGQGTVRLRTFQEGPMVVVELNDDGPGISPDDMSRLFEPFFTTKPQGEGTGLGLDIVWRIVVEEHGGEITVESESGSTTFLVKIPICPDARSDVDSDA